MEGITQFNIEHDPQCKSLFGPFQPEQRILPGSRACNKGRSSSLKGLAYRLKEKKMSFKVGYSPCLLIEYVEIGIQRLPKRKYSKIPILRPPLGLSKSGLKDHSWTFPKVVSNQRYTGCKT